jgi:hypothetical protein
MEYTIQYLQHPNLAYTNCVYVTKKTSDYIYLHTDSGKYMFKVVENNKLNNSEPYIEIGLLQRQFLNINPSELIETTPIDDITRENIVLLDTLNVNLYVKNTTFKLNTGLSDICELSKRIYAEMLIKKTLLTIPIYKGMTFSIQRDYVNNITSSRLHILNKLEDNICYMIDENTNIVTNYIDA